jgi:hypothetical protein
MVVPPWEFSVGISWCESLLWVVPGWFCWFEQKKSPARAGSDWEQLRDDPGLAEPIRKKVTAVELHVQRFARLGGICQPWVFRLEFSFGPGSGLSAQGSSMPVKCFVYLPSLMKSGSTPTTIWAVFGQVAGLLEGIQSKFVFAAYS